MAAASHSLHLDLSLSPTLSLQLCLAATYCKFPCPHCRPYNALDTEAAPPSWRPPHTPCTSLYLSLSSSVSLPLTASFPVHIAALTTLWTQKLPHHHGARLTLPAPLSISLSPALSRCHLLQVSLSTLPPLQRSGHRSCPTIMAAASHLLYLFLTPWDSSLVQCSHCPQGVHILGAEGKKHTGKVWIEHVLSIDQRNLFVLSGEYNFCHELSEHLLSQVKRTSSITSEENIFHLKSRDNFSVSSEEIIFIHK